MGATPSEEAATGDAPLVEVRLLGLPLLVLEAARVHTEELTREFALLAVAPADGPTAVPHRMLHLIEVLGARYGALSEGPEAEIDAALAAGRRSLDVVYRVPADAADAVDQLEGMLEQADEFCRAEQMLTIERTPVIRAFASWYFQEFRRQVAGMPPRAWDGPPTP